ncbi:MAG: type I pantothenate kinase, partial [Bacteroidota bacterium]|nr:type I pantothenate kinase [Bacteroidota bacterium]
WASLRNMQPMSLTAEEVQKLRGINDELSIDEVRDIYMPLARLLNYYLNARLNRQSALMQFLNQQEQHIPFIISVGGSVSVGKTTSSRVLQALLSHWKENLKVVLVTTDGFLYPNAVLEEKGLMMKKGFPQSYDTHRLLQFVMDVKSGKSHLQAPRYSHKIYDVVPDEFQEVDRPDILILEGLNVLQSTLDAPHPDQSHAFVSDFVDFSIYVDADEALLEEWFLSRFLKLRETAFTDPDSFFVNYSKLPVDESINIARTAWRDINLVNLRQHILPTRYRASLILHKNADHLVDYVQLRK